MTVSVVETRVTGENPFYDCIKEYLDTSNLEERLSASPIRGEDVKHMSLERRYQLLDQMQEEMFEPTTSSLDITTRIFRMMGRGLQGLDPTKASVRKTTMTIGRYAGTELSKLPWFSTYAIGMHLKGPTGCGKSYEVVRALKLIPPRINHRLHEAAGWTHMVQATWLYVPMSHDGSLGGLLFQILCSLDAAIDSHYSEDRSLRSLSNEKLAIQVGIILRNHGVGLLVIDEIQARNFSDNARGTLAATFFLRLLNFGIPIVLLGNPFGIDALNSFSQDMRRLGAGGSIRMDPHEVGDSDWTECLCPAIWNFIVLPDQQDRSFMTPEVLFRYSGGIRDYACRIWTATQRMVLGLGRTAATKDDLEAAFWGPDFGDRDRDLIAGFRDKDLLLLQQFVDIPWEDYGMRWGILTNKGDESKNATATPKDSGTSSHSQQEQSSGSEEKAASAPPRKKTAPEKAKENVKRNRTQASNKAKQRTEAKQTLSEQDIRADGLKKCLVSGFESLKNSDK